MVSEICLTATLGGALAASSLGALSSRSSSHGVLATDAVAEHKLQTRSSSHSPTPQRRKLLRLSQVLPDPVLIRVRRLGMAYRHTSPV